MGDNVTRIFGPTLRVGWSWDICSSERESDLLKVTPPGTKPWLHLLINWDPEGQNFERPSQNSWLSAAVTLKCVSASKEGCGLSSWERCLDATALRASRAILGEKTQSHHSEHKGLSLPWWLGMVREASWSHCLKQTNENKTKQSEVWFLLW